MIDLTNAPEGTTGYYVGSVTTHFYNGSKCWSEVNKEWLESLSGDEWLSINVVPLKPKWSIYNNTLPLSELSDEQRGLLFNHRCNGGDIETESSSGWRVINNPQWIVTSTYRAKQKTERELFIDEWSSKITTNEYNGGNVRSLVGQMFDDVNGIK